MDVSCGRSVDGSWNSSWGGASPGGRKSMGNRASGNCKSLLSSVQLHRAVQKRTEVNIIGILFPSVLCVLQQRQQQRICA